jgi:CubicO group peptidase (beta-lactamase class C family)
VAFDRDREIGSFADGFADPAVGRAVTADDPVRIASVSKLGVAIGVMRLVEQGKLDLDADVSRWLGWRLRNPAHPDASISLRMLLSHTSSVRDHDDNYAIPLGGSLRTILSDPTAWDARHAPDASFFTYANLNFPIIGSIIERATGQRFDIWMRREVLEPMKLDACYNWPTCSEVAVIRAVVLTQNGEAVRDDLGGKRPPCPVFARDNEPCDLARWKLGDNGALFAPQGGLRISARGLATIGRMLLNDGVADGVRILSPRSVAALLAPQWQFTGTNGVTEKGFYCSFGLATQRIANLAPGCRDDVLRDGGAWVGHAGEAYGLRSGLWIDRTRGVGVAYFVTGLADKPAPGDGAFVAAEEAAFRRSAALLRR